MSETWGEPDDDWGSASAATPLLAALSLWCCAGVLAALTCSPLRRAPWRPLLLLWAAAEMLLQLQVLAGWITLKEHADVEVEEAWAAALSWLLGATQYASLCRGPLLAAALAAGPQFRRAVRAALAPRPGLAHGPDNHVLLVNMNEEEDNT
ncbi:uncharacterized protein LOC126322551 [Schistocerca gregaria]|uniref:uncharacterized protein LOC126322551 n=1 Tax=Schistocerca gregaria TaxID=7010 RepID=UPI00211E091F|nr:uncharacterized protein LOC126322551 [Schistocerca gregaria]